MTFASHGQRVYDSTVFDLFSRRLVSELIPLVSAKFPQGLGGVVPGGEQVATGGGGADTLSPCPGQSFWTPRRACAECGDLFLGPTSRLSGGCTHNAGVAMVPGIQ